MPKLRPDLHRELRAGLAHHQEGRLDAAEKAYRHVLKWVPDEPDALNLLGVIVQERGRPARAVQLISQAVRARRDFPAAWTNLARAQRAAGDPTGAVQSARHAVERDPALAEAHAQLGRALLDLHDDAAAAEALRRAVELAPGSLDSQVNLAAALTRLGDFEAAAKVYQEAHKLRPERAETLIDFGAALTELQRFDDALRCHARAIALAPNDARAHAAHAVTLKRSQDAAGAAEACRRSLALAPDGIDVWLVLGGCLASLGRFDEAIDAYRRALTLDPNCAEAQRGIVAAGERSADPAELDRLQAIADDTAQPALPRVSANYALGGLLDKAGDYDAAFRHYAAANALKRAINEENGEGFDAAASRRQVDTTISGFTSELFAATRDWGDPSELPVFIVGMPRSGTTLAEQIVASHPAAFGAGERREIGTIARKLEVENDSAAPAAWPREMIRAEAVAHLARLQGLGGDALRVTDKMPDNVFFLGVIALLYPRARIVLCRRDLRDVCLSCYFQSFSQGMPWSNDLEDCATRALEVERLVQHWRAVLPLPMLELSYEELVADLEGQSRRLIEFIGLPWDPACLDFHTTERQVMTASLWQVRQPLYSTSVGRWRHYARHIAPLCARLAAGLQPTAPVLRRATSGSPAGVEIVAANGQPAV